MQATLFLAVVAAFAPGFLSHQTNSDPDPAAVDVVDAIECKLDAPTYNGFAMALNGEEQIAKKRHWVPVKSGNPMLNEYALPAPITVAGTYRTSRVAFTSSGVLAILDLADPAPLAREQGIANAADPKALADSLRESGEAPPPEFLAMMARSNKFLGEKVVVDRVEPPAAGESFGIHTRITRNISTVTSHPGKTLYGCSYRIEPIGKDGKPL